MGRRPDTSRTEIQTWKGQGIREARKIRLNTKQIKEQSRSYLSVPRAVQTSPGDPNGVTIRPELPRLSSPKSRLGLVAEPTAGGGRVGRWNE